jgi:hypothetical protein
MDHWCLVSVAVAPGVLLPHTHPSPTSQSSRTRHRELHPQRGSSSEEEKRRTPARLAAEVS